MKILQSKTSRTIILIILLLVTSISLTAVFLLNLPFFYQQNNHTKLTTFVITFAGFFLLDSLLLKVLVFSYLKNAIKLKNLFLIGFLIIFLIITIGIGSNYYWSVPTLHHVEICFDAEDGSSTIIIPELTHHISNRLFPPEGFGLENYPLFLESGECVQGTVMTLYRRVMRFWNQPGMTVFIRQDPPDGRLFLNVNNTPTAVYFDQDSEEQPDNEVTVTAGFESGLRMDSPWDKTWFMAVKLLGVGFSAFGLALFLFGFTERVLKFSFENRKKPEKIKLPVFKGIHLNKPPGYRILLVLTLIYFLVFGTFMAHTAGQPDQAPHKYYSSRFAEAWGIPEDNPDMPYVVTGQPYLAYWLNGTVYKVYRLLFPSGQLRSDLLWRMTSVILSTLTVYYLYKLTTRATGNPYAGVLSAFLLANTMMFVFMSGGISYDNLMNLASMAAIYHLVSVYKKEDFIRHTTLTGIWVVMGALTKEQFLLMTLIIFLAWLFFVIQNRKRIHLDFNRTNIILAGAFLIALVLFLGLYGINLFRYKKPTPSCYQIKGIGKCGSFTYRSEFFSQLSLPGLWFKRDAFQNPINYALDFWAMLNIESTWGVFSHNTFILKLSTALHSLILLWFVICLARYWQKKDEICNVLLFILLAFVGFMFFFNYKQDVEYDFRHYAVSGRYLFPSIGALVTLMVHYFLKVRSTVMKRLTIIITAIIYFNGGLWMFLSRYSEVFIHWRIYF